MDELRIGALAERTGTNAPTIRYYEEIGLLRPPDRQPGGQRVYGEEDLKRLTFIRRCRQFGFPIEQVRSLVGLLNDRSRSCMEARDLALEHLAAVRVKLRDLTALEKKHRRLRRELRDNSVRGRSGPRLRHPGGSL
jgi:DNA-binding transcriptional MerR regulator